MGSRTSTIRHQRLLLESKGPSSYLHPTITPDLPGYRNGSQRPLAIQVLQRGPASPSHTFSVRVALIPQTKSPHPALAYR